MKTENPDHIVITNSQVYSRKEWTFTDADGKLWCRDPLGVNPPIPCDGLLIDIDPEDDPDA